MSIPWSKKTMEQRLDALLRYYTKEFERYGGSDALTHENHKNDPERYAVLTNYYQLVVILTRIKEG